MTCKRAERREVTTAQASTNDSRWAQISGRLRGPGLQLSTGAIPCAVLSVAATVEADSVIAEPAGATVDSCGVPGASPRKPRIGSCLGPFTMILCRHGWTAAIWSC